MEAVGRLKGRKLIQLAQGSSAPCGNNKGKGLTGVGLLETAAAPTFPGDFPVMELALGDPCSHM